MVNAVTQILGQRATSVASTEKEFLRAGLRRWFYSGVGLLVVAAMSWYWLRATEIACRRDVTARWTIDWNYENCKADPSGCGDSPQHQKWVMGLQQSGCLVTGELHLEAEGDKRSRTDALFGAVNQSKVLFSIDVGSGSTTELSTCAGSIGETTLVARCFDLRPAGPVSWKMTGVKLAD